MESLNLSILQNVEQNQTKSHVMKMHQTMIYMYVFSSVLAIVGNVFVIIVLLRSFHRRLSLSSYKLNLAVSDLCIIIFCVPFTSFQEEFGHWIFGTLMCPLILFLQLCCVCCSAYTNVAIGFDRFLAVIYPLESRPYLKNRLLIIVLVWLLSSTIACPVLIVARSVESKAGNHSQPSCNEIWTTRTQKNIYTLAVFVVLFIIPTAFLSVTYSRVVYTLWKRDTPGNAHKERDRRRLASKKKIITMVISVVVMFVTCWLPWHLLNIVISLEPDVFGKRNAYILDHLFFACHWLGVSHAFVNPVIYVTTDSEFRTKLLEIFISKKAPLRIGHLGSRCQIKKSFITLDTSPKGKMNFIFPKNIPLIGISELKHVYIGPRNDPPVDELSKILCGDNHIDIE